MKYASLAQIKLTIIDGRTNDKILRVFLTGALLALGDHHEGHVLVAASSSGAADEYETMGENAGVDFFFHGQAIGSSDEFLTLCANASMVIMPSRWPTQTLEVSRIVESGKIVAVSDSVAETFPPFPGQITFATKGLNSLRAKDLIEGKVVL